MFDAAGAVHCSRTRLMPAFSPLASLPRRGSLVVSDVRSRSALLLSALLRRGDGKWSVSLGICTEFCSMVSLGGRVGSLLMECCRVALSSVIGDRVSGMVAKSSLRMCRHLGAMGRS